MARINRTKQMHQLLLAIGAILLSGGVLLSFLEFDVNTVVDIRGNTVTFPSHTTRNTIVAFLKNISSIISSVGGVFLGLSLSWLIEEKYKKNDERENAIELYEKSLALLNQTVSAFDKTIKRTEIYPNEVEIKKFRRTPLYLYHSTKSEQGDMFWHVTVLDFRSAGILKRMTTTTTFVNFDRTKEYTYKAELFRPYPNDCVTLALRPDKTQEALCIGVYDACKEYTQHSFGYLYHDDWRDSMRLSPSILSFVPILDSQEIGPLDKNMSDKLNIMWHNNLKTTGKKIFEGIMPD